jgi:hypothetical protein
MIEENEKFALVALPVGAASKLEVTKIAADLWAGSRPIVPLTSRWREWLGTIRVNEIERCNVFLLTKMRSSKPGDVDQENKDLENQAWRGYLGLLLTGLSAVDPPLMISGARQQAELSIRQLINLPTGSSRAQWRLTTKPGQWEVAGASTESCRSTPLRGQSSKY